MYGFKDFLALDSMRCYYFFCKGQETNWDIRRLYDNAFWSVYRRKFDVWIKDVKSCEEIAQLGCWDVDPDTHSSPYWTPAGRKFDDLCRKEMSATNDLLSLWELYQMCRRCMFTYEVKSEVFSKILSLTTDIDELKQLAYPQTYEDRVKTVDHLAKPYYTKTIEGLMLKCRSVEELRKFLSTHEIPTEAKPLSLRLIAQLPDEQELRVIKLREGAVKKVDGAVT